MKCPQCLYENPDENHFCRKCGADLGLKCPGCHSGILPTDNFCGNCGQDLRTRKEDAASKSSVSESSTSGPGERRDVQKKHTNSIGQKFVLIPAGTFMMGSPKGEKNHYDNEILHEVTLSKSLYVQKTPVTQGQWRSVMGDNPSEFAMGDHYPVESVSWHDAQEFILKLNTMEKTQKYRLLSEAEWEYACRAGSQEAWCFGSDEDRLGEYAWYWSNSVGSTHIVAMKRANAWGLHDMHGNVWEWCRDCYGPYSPDPVTDPTGLGNGSSRVIRGGAWSHGADRCRSANRGGSNPDSRRGNNLGFRLAMDH